MQNRKLVLTVTIAFLILALAPICPVLPDYSNAGSRGPYVKEHWWRVTNHPDNQLIQLITHQVDAGPISRPYGIQELRNHGFTVTSVTDFDMAYLAFNCRVPPFDNKEFRRAMAHMVNKDQVVALYAPLVQKANYWLPPGQAGWINPDASLPGYSPDTAAQILDGAGYAQGSTPNPHYDPTLSWSAEYIRIDPQTGTDMLPIVFTVHNDVLPREAVEIIVDTINKMGIPTGIETKLLDDILGEVATTIEHWYRLKFPWPLGLSESSDEWQVLYGFSLEFNTEPILYEIFKSDQPWNIWGINDTELDNWCNKTRQTLDGTKVQKAIYKIQELATKLMPCLPMFTSNRYMAYVGPNDPTSTGYIGIVNSPGNPRLFAGAPCYDSIQNRWVKMLGRKMQQASNEWEEMNMWILSTPIHNLNPLWQFTNHAWQILDLVHDRLLEQNPYTFYWMPWVASELPTTEEWTGPEGEVGMTIEFTLREDVYWHDSDPGPDMEFGTPDDGNVSRVTAEDCVFALNLLKTQGAPAYYSTCGLIDHIQQTSPYSFKVYYKERYIYAFVGISNVALLCPKHIWEPFIAGPDGQLWTADDKYIFEWTGWDESYIEDPQYEGRYLTKLIGCGPFVYHHGNLDPYTSVCVRANQLYLSGHICPGDVDFDQKVETDDVNRVMEAFGSMGDPNWDVACDIAPPAQIINLDEIYTVVIEHFGHYWGPGPVPPGFVECPGC